MEKMKKRCFKVILLGDSGVGKTCLIEQYKKAKFSGSNKATIGADFCNKEVFIDGQIISL
jgi:Ras-related protein Rab-7A